MNVCSSNANQALLYVTNVENEIKHVILYFTWITHVNVDTPVSQFSPAGEDIKIHHLSQWSTVRDTEGFCMLGSFGFKKKVLGT